ncbi:NADH dehydrogenase subunit 4, partial [Tanacetum coccineum]
AAQKPYSSTGAGLVLRGSNSKWYQGDVVVPSVFFMEGSIIQDILERRIDKCDEEMEIPEKSTNKSNMAMNVSVLSGPYLLMTDLHSQLMTLNDLRTLGGQACLRLGCFAVAWGIMVRRDRRAPHTAMPTAAFESIFGTAYIRTHTYKPMDTGTYSISIGLLKSDLFRGTRAERRVTIFTSSFGLINQTPIDWEMLKEFVVRLNLLVPGCSIGIHRYSFPPPRKEGAFPAAYFAKRWQERNDLAQTYLNNLKAWPGLKEEESQPCRKADRRVGWSGMRSYGKEYITASLIREFLMIAVFRMLDPLLFYVLPESVLIPMLCGAEHLIFAGIKLFLCRGLVHGYLLELRPITTGQFRFGATPYSTIIIGVWGSRQRKIKAAYQLFLYTLLGSVFMLLAILLILFQTGTTDLQILLTTEFSERRQIFLWIAFFASFAVKVPMVPVHIWLPEAHVEAPTAGSVFLAGILLKLGTYGFLRFSIPMFPEATLCFTPFIYTLSAIAIIYTSLTTLRQIDLKKIIAYSSVAHMNLVTIGMFSLNIQGIGGSILLMLSHGLVSSALFLCVGVLYDRHKTRLVRYYGGLVSTMPNFSTIFFFFTLANMSLPGTSSFIGEFLILVGAFQRNSLVATLAALGMILGAAYSLWLYNRVVSGNLKPDFLHKFSDLNGREVFIFIPFLVGVVWMGVYPKVFPDCMHTSIVKQALNTDGDSPAPSTAIPPLDVGSPHSQIGISEKPLCREDSLLPATKSASISSS